VAVQEASELPAHLAGRVSIEEAAAIMGVSSRTVRYRAVEYGGVQLRPGRGPQSKWLFDPTELRRKKNTRHLAPRQLAVGPGRRESEGYEGERDARVVGAFEAGKSIAAIVVAEKIPLTIVIGLREKWLAAHEADRQGLKFTCGCGSPSNPNTAKCEKCAERSRALTDAQLASLTGGPAPEPETCVCSGCGDRASTLAADHICGKCGPRLTVAVRDGRLHAVLNGKSLRELTADETKTIAGMLAPPPPVEPVESTAAVSAAEIESLIGKPKTKGKLKSEVSSMIDKVRREIQEEMATELDTVEAEMKKHGLPIAGLDAARVQKETE
jgi:hypothetical protein